MKLDRKELMGIISTVVLLGSGFYAFGRLDGRVDQLEKRVDGLDARVDPLRQLKVGKGDLCLKMLEQLGNARDSKRQQELQDQWAQLDCGGLPANATSKSAAEGYAASENGN
jgi:hypothetical protein